jgi:hypothetical protein
MPYLIIICIVIIFYIRTIEYSIVVDDIRQYTALQKGWNAFPKERFKGLNLFQKIRYLFGFIRLRLYGAGTFGMNTITDHVFTLIIHIITCCLIYPAFGSNIISLWASILYAVNPINNQTSIWLNGRRYQIVIILSLLAILFKPLGIIFYLLTPAFQFTAFFLPILYSDVSIWFNVIPIILGIVFYKKIVDHENTRLKRIYNDDQKTWSLNRIIVVIKTYGVNFFKMLHPGIVMMNKPNLIKWGVTKEGNADAYAWNYGLLRGILALLLTGFIISVPNLRLYGLFILFGTLQWSAISAGHQQLADRYISLVNVFVMYALVYVIYTYMPQLAPIICMGIFSYYATQLNMTMKMYRSIEEFFEYQMFYYPTMSRNRVIFADSYMTVKDVTRAWLIVERGLFHEPNDFELLIRAAQCSASVGMIEKAEHFIERAEKNYYIGQEEIQKKRLEILRNQIKDVIRQMNPSRQVRRQMERKHGKG